MNAIRINLLPYRQMRRARAQRLFVLLALVAAGAGVGIVLLVQFLLTQQITLQEGRNAFLRNEITGLERRITEINELKEKTKGLLAKKDVVESLQSNRGENIRLFLEIARQLPEGLYLKSLKQRGDALDLSGYAQSSARVSTYMRSLDESSLFRDPVLVEVKAAQVGNLRANEFSLSVKIEKATPDAGKAPKGAGGKP
ncbi:MAG: PilN domain-containing protein [Betaproteobacteria bacterium]|nr:PilN domain-containing protein [Betaproteobacteria bacterium]